MKVGIVTFHFVNNFGGLLQAYALQRVLRNKYRDISFEIIDYRNQFIAFTDAVRVFPVTRNTDAIKSGLKTMKERFERGRRFHAFMKENAVISPRYSFSDLKHNKAGYDKYICGSDQIWNPVITGGVDKVYFLTFEKDRNKKCAYAPSFGSGDIPSVFLPKIVKNVENIGTLSVREKRSIRFIEKISGGQISRLIDPTFLLSVEEWREVEKDVEVPEHYILLYIMQTNYDVYSALEEIKEKYKLPVVEISRYGYKSDLIDYMHIGIGPSDFLTLFDKADVVCTNSYHGLVFSMIFDKVCHLVPSKKFGLRIINLLELLEVDTTEIVGSTVLNEIVYDKEKYREKIEEEKNRSLSFLGDFIENEGNN